MMKKTSIPAFFLVSLLMCNSTIAAEQSTQDLAKATQNPLASMISLPFQNNTNFGIGPDDETQNILNIQPVWPFSLNDNWNLVTRTILPVISQPGVLTDGEGRVNGLGDTTFTGWLSPANPGKWIWGVGAAFLIPTATDDALGSDKWGAGPTIVLLTTPGKWVVGSLFSNVWSFAGSGDQDVNLFTWQYFINYNLSDGWYLTSAPVITANWEASSGEKWTVPFGAGGGKVFVAGKQPMKLQVQAYVNAVAPAGAPDWTLQIQYVLLFPHN